MAERLGDAEKSYYGRVVDLLKGRDEEEETDAAFFENVLGQIQSDGVARVFCDKEGSRAVERLLQAPESDAAFVTPLLEPVVADFNSVAKDRCGSHAMEAVLKSVGRQLDHTDSRQTLEALFLRVFQDIKASLSDLLSHPYASHVVCAAVQVVSGVYVAERLTRSRYSREFRKAKMQGEGEHQSKAVFQRSVAVPQSFMDVLNKLGRWVCKLENLEELLVDVCASPVLQVLLRVLVERLPKRGNKMIQKVLKLIELSVPDREDDKGESPLPHMFTSAVGSHLVCVLLEVASAELHQWIWESCFKGRVLSSALHPLANYPLQQFMAMADSAQISLVVSEMLPHLEDVLFVGHSGVVVKLAEAGLRSAGQQQEIVEALLSAFHAESDRKCCVPLFLALTAYEVYSEHEEKMESDKDIARRPIHIQGSLMVQALLKYENPKVVAGSILKMENDDVVRLSCDVAGSHVIDVFLTSPTVTSVKKTKLINKIKPHLVSLCKDKHGSRVMDAVWRSSKVSEKENLAEDLLAHEAQLSEDFYGRIVLRNCNVAHYRRKQAVWQKKVGTADKTRELFHDILEEEPAALEKGRRKRKRSSGGERQAGAIAGEVEDSELSHRRKKRPLLFEKSND